MAPSRAKTGTWPVLTDLTRDQLSRCVAHAPTENTLWEQNPYKEPAAAWTSRVHGAESGSEKQSEPCRSRAWRCFAGTTKTGHSQSPFSRRGGGVPGIPCVSTEFTRAPNLAPAPRAPFPRFQLRRSGVSQKDLLCPPAILTHSLLFLRLGPGCGTLRSQLGAKSNTQAWEVRERKPVRAPRWGVSRGDIRRRGTGGTACSMLAARCRP